VEALQMGLLSRVVEPVESALDAALQVAVRLTTGSADAQAAAKSAIDRGLAGTPYSGVSLEGDLFAAVAVGPAAQARQSALLDSRPERP
jgi:enoyl-CoA hydratase